MRTLPRAIIIASSTAVALLSLWYVLCGIYTLSTLLRLPQIISIAEPQAIAASLRVVARLPMFTDYRTQFPIMPLPYGALEYWIPGMFARVSGVSNAEGVLLIGRSFSLAALVTILVLNWLLLRQDGFPGVYSVLAALPLFWSTYPLRWAAQFAPDYPAVALSLAGWLFARRSFRARSRAGQMLGALFAAVLWTVAFHVKPTMIPGLIAFAVECFAGRGQRRFTAAFSKAAPPLLTFMLFAAITSLCANWLTSGLWYLNCIRSNAYFEFSPRYMLSSLTFRSTLIPLWVTCLLISLFAIKHNVISRAVLITVIAECLFMMKQGSNSDYVLGSIALFGCSLPQVFRDALGKLTFHSKRLAAWLPATPLPFLALVLAYNARNALVPAHEFPAPTAGEISAVNRAVAEHGGSRVLCMDPFTALRTGAFYPFAEPLEDARLSELNIVRHDSVIENIHKRVYRVVIVGPYYYQQPVYHGLKLFPDDIRNAVSKNYREVSRGYLLHFLIPGAN